MTCKLLHVLAELFFYHYAQTWPFKDQLSHVKVSRNEQIFRKWTFLMLGQNVTAKLDEKYVDKMSLWDKILQ
jgi:hypothetical protein